MTIALKSISPPQPIAMAVKAHKRTLMLSLDALRAGAPALVLEAARGAFGARDALINLCSKIEAIEFELSYHDAAVSLAMAEDQAAEASWRSDIQMMDPEEIISGITRDSCCSKCSPGGGYCVISGSVPHAAGTCSHPLTQRHLWHRSEDGAVHYPYKTDARSYANYLAACRRLKVPPS